MSNPKYCAGQIFNDMFFCDDFTEDIHCGKVQLVAKKTIIFQYAPPKDIRCGKKVNYLQICPAKK